MPTIERKPLPPPNSRATAITEADRAEIVARANNVIDYYLNGPGSYWDAGPRKPLQETINDLQNFKDHVIASKQFADDPNSIMDSIIELIRQTTDHVKAVQNNEDRDGIAVPPPNTNDPIDDPGVISPRLLSNAALPVSLPPEGEQPAPPPQAGGAPGITSSKPVRILSRRTADRPPASAFDTSAPATQFMLPDNPGSMGGLAGRIAALAGIDPEHPDQPAPQPGGLLRLYLSGRR